MNYISSQSFHTLTHWQSGQGGGGGNDDPLKLKNIKTFPESQGAFYMGGWVDRVENPSGSQYTPMVSWLALPAYAYHEADASIAGLYNVSRETSYSEGYTAGGNLYHRRYDLPNGEVVYRAKYTSDTESNPTFYLKIVRDTILTELVPDAIKYPTGYYDTDGSPTDYITYYTADGDGTYSAQARTFLRAADYPASAFIAGYTGRVLVPYIRKYAVYQYRQEQGADINSVFDDCIEVSGVYPTNPLSMGQGAIFNWAMSADSNLKAIGELRQYPNNLFSHDVVNLMGNEPNQSIGHRADFPLYGVNPIAGFIDGSTITTDGYTGLTGYYYGGWTCTSYTYTGSTKHPTYTGGYFALNGYDMTTDGSCLLTVNPLEGSLIDGYTVMIYQRVVDIKTQNNFKFFT